MCGPVCHGCNDVTLFRQASDTVQFMILKDCSGRRVCGGGVGRAERRQPDKLLQPRSDAWAKGRGEELERDGWTLEILGR